MRSSTSLCCSVGGLFALISACGSSGGGGGQVDNGQPQADGGTGLGPSEIVIDDASAPTNLPTLGDGAPNGQVGSTALDDAACATEVRRGEQTPLDLYIVLDSSGSMVESTGASGARTSTTKWDAVSNALISFVDDPASAGLGVGLQYFPLTRPGIPASCTDDAMCKGAGPCDLPRSCRNSARVTSCTSDADCPGDQCGLLGQCSFSGQACSFIGSRCSGNGGTCEAIAGYCHGRDVCEAASYATPDVPIAPLPGVAAAIVRSLSTHAPDGLTPTSSALTGALDRARAQASAHPERRVVVVLATDGLPTECAPTDIASISLLASAAAVAASPITTFVIGVFAPDEATVARPNLDAIAKAGGSTQALIVQTNQNVSQAFLQALDTVRTTALTCEYAIPTPQSGVLDYQSVNVRFTSGAGKTVTLGYAGDAASCGTAGGWYYDQSLGSARAPSKIEICPTTCNSLKADTRGQVNVLFGCRTETAVL